MASRKSKTPYKQAIAVEKRSFAIPMALALALVAATFAAHFPSVYAVFTWDDNVSLYENPLIAAPDGLYKFWFTTKASDYWPLTATMTWLEWRMWGKNPMPYHVANILLHAIAAVLLWRVLLRLKVGVLGAFLAGLLFAIHPVTVESVAWISERKNLLSMVLFLLTILAYLRFDDSKQARWYVTALLIALAALLAKSSVVMLPIVLLICIWWRRSRVTRQDFLHMLPFFAMSLILGLVTIWFQRHHAIADAVVRPEGIASRIAAVGWVFWFYLYKLVIPINLAMIYPRWDIDGGNVISYLPLALLIACFVVLWRYRNTWGRGPLAALGAFAVILTPVLGLLDMSYARFSLVADHLQYPGIPAVLALIGAGLATAWSWLRNGNRMALAHALSVVIVATVLALAVLTWRQSRVYQDEITLWSHTIAINDRAWAAYGNRSNAHNDKQAYNLAIQDCTKAIQLNPDYADAYVNRGIACSRLGNHDQAILDHTKAIKIQPNYAKAFNNRCIAYAAKGACDQAIRDCTKAIALDRNDPDAYYNRGMACASKGDNDLAILDYSKAIELNPGDAEAYYNRGTAYGAKGNYDQTIRDYTKAIELKSDYDAAYLNRGNAYGAKGDHAQAARDFTKAIDLKPANPGAYYNRSVAHFTLKEYDKAWADVNKCRQLGGTPDPNLVKQLTEATGRTE